MWKLVSVRYRVGPKFAVLRHVALNLLKKVQGTKVGIQIRRLRAGRDNDFFTQFSVPLARKKMRLPWGSRVLGGDMNEEIIATVRGMTVVDPGARPAASEVLRRLVMALGDKDERLPVQPPTVKAVNWGGMAAAAGAFALPLLITLGLIGSGVCHLPRHQKRMIEVEVGTLLLCAASSYYLNDQSPDARRDLA